VVAHLASERAQEIERSKRAIDSSEDLRFVFEQAIQQPIRGEVEKLYQLLTNVVDPFTAHAVAKLDVRVVLARDSKSPGVFRPSEMTMSMM
jgi:hypothetical protein